MRIMGRVTGQAAALRSWDDAMRAEPLAAEARVSDGATADSVSAYLERLIEEDEGRERLCKFTDEHFEGVDTVGPLTLAPCLCVVRRRRAPEQRARATTMTTRRIHGRGRASTD